MIGTAHPWNDIDPGENSPEIVKAVIEIRKDEIKPTLNK
ncbi:hypothetical protein C8N28_2249 [Albibacterium bauzanense]|uniref:Uncharacterized protein n=1 Tax=Albibacterium bauzanense TaxID=653929 RepID=A0A4R1LYJ7_9SPHI|nr:hypothetical protein C8N28_2249 [Albibacterium bauzanense]